jgi:hypothetical protein
LYPTFEKCQRVSSSDRNPRESPPKKSLPCGKCKAAGAADAAGVASCVGSSLIKIDDQRFEKATTQFPTNLEEAVALPLPFELNRFPDPTNAENDGFSLSTTCWSMFICALAKLGCCKM